MASPFQRYQSGIEASTGNLVSAYGEMAKQTAAGIGGFGDAVAEGINKYHEIKAKNDVVTGEGEQLAETLTGYYDVLSKDPEFQQYAESFIKPTLTSLQNLHELNFAKKAGVVAGAKAKYQDMANSLNLYQKMKELKLKRDIAEGEEATKGKKASGAKPAVAVTRWNPYKTADENYLDFKTQLDNARKAGFKGDDNEAIYNWLDSVADDALNGTFEGLSPEQSELLRGGVQDQIYALRERLSDQLSGVTPNEGDVMRSGMNAKDFLANRTVGAQTVVTDATGKPVSVNLPPPSSDKNINRGPIARFVRTKRGLVRVEVNQEYPSDMIDDATNSVIIEPESKPAPAPTSAPAALPAPEKAKTAEATSAPATLPAPSTAKTTETAPVNSDAEKAREINRLTDEQMILNDYLQSLNRDKYNHPILSSLLLSVAKIIGLTHTPRDAKGNIIINAEDSARIRERFAANAKRLIELRGGTETPEALPAPESAKPAPAPVPEALPAPESAPASTPAPAKKESTTTNKDLSIGTYAKSLGVSYEQFEKSVADSGLPSYEFYKQLKTEAEKNGVSVEQFYKGMYAPAEEALPPPPSKTPVAEEKAPEGLPAPEEKPIKIATREDKAKQYLELGASQSNDGTIRYTVQKGDTPARIAKRFGMSQKALLDMLEEEGKQWKDVQVDTTIPLMKLYEEASISEEEATGKLPPSTSEAKEVIVGGTDADRIKFSKDGKVIRTEASDTVKNAETHFARVAHGKNLTSAEREIEASKKAIVGLSRYIERLSNPKPYLGAETNWLGGFASNEDFYVPEFDQEFLDTTAGSGEPTKIKGGVKISNPLKETQAWKDSWGTLYNIHDKFSYSRYAGGRVGKAIFGDNWSQDDRLEAMELIKAQIKKLEDNLPTLVNKREELGKRTPTYAEMVAAKKGTPETPASILPETAPLMGEINTTVGTKEVSTDYTAEEKKDRLKAFLMERYKDSEGRSYIPSGFDSIYNSLHPEANLRIIDTAIGPMYWDGNSYKQATNTSKQPTTQDIREARRGVFGTQTEKGWIPQEVGEGTGVYLAGLFNRSDADLAKFDEMVTANASGLQALRGIKEILKTPLHSIPYGKKRAEAYGKVQVYIAALKSAIRTDIVGVGTVSNFEQTMIKLAVPDPTELWRLDDADWGRVAELENRLKNQLINTGALKGVSVMIQEPEAEKNVESALRMGNKRLK